VDPATLDGARSIELDELLPRSSALTLHARLTPDTRQMIGAAQLARLPHGAVLVNTARGGLLDYEAAIDALESGQLGAAAFDVFGTEPLPASSRLRTTPRTVLTPHLAGATRQTAERAATLAADEVVAYLDQR
jgi:D-3-phosphoglycerate dehydrogenase